MKKTAKSLPDKILAIAEMTDLKQFEIFEINHKRDYHLVIKVDSLEAEKLSEVDSEHVINALELIFKNAGWEAECTHWALELHKRVSELGGDLVPVVNTETRENVFMRLNNVLLRIRLNKPTQDMLSACWRPFQGAFDEIASRECSVVVRSTNPANPAFVFAGKPIDPNDPSYIIDNLELDRQTVLDHYNEIDKELSSSVLKYLDLVEQFGPAKICPLKDDGLLIVSDKIIGYIVKQKR